MAKKDVTGLTLQFTNEKIARLRSIVKDKVDIGPGNIQTSNKEARIIFQNMSPENKQAYIQRIGGHEAWDRLMEKLYAA